MRALDDLPLFAGLDGDALRTLAQQLIEIRLPGGVALFEQDSPADGLYVLRSGQLAAFRQRGATRQWLGSIRPGEAVGEMALLSGRPRSAQVVALRDSTLWRLDRSAFDELVLRHPRAALELARTAFARMEAAAQQRLRPRVPATLAVLPQSPGVDVHGLAASLAEALGRYGAVACVRRGDSLEPARLSALEDAHAQVIYIGEADAEDWAATDRKSVV